MRTRRIGKRFLLLLDALLKLFRLLLHSGDLVRQVAHLPEIEKKKKGKQVSARGSSASQPIHTLLNISQSASKNSANTHDAAPQDPRSPFYRRRKTHLNKGCYARALPRPKRNAFERRPATRAANRAFPLVQTVRECTTITTHDPPICTRLPQACTFRSENNRSTLDESSAKASSIGYPPLYAQAANASDSQHCI